MDNAASGQESTPLHHPRSYFDSTYADAIDPWGFDSRWYEQRKYDLTLAALPDRRYRRALEPGCANGALTARLAGRCDELIAFDLVDQVATRATSRLADEPGVVVHSATFPTWWPHGSGDLVVWSEIVYYLTPEGLDVALDGLQRWLDPGGVLIAVHYTGATDYPMTGKDAHDRVGESPFLTTVGYVQDPQFHIDVWRHTP